MCMCVRMKGVPAGSSGFPGPRFGPGSNEKSNDRLGCELVIFRGAEWNTSLRDIPSSLTIQRDELLKAKQEHGYLCVSENDVNCLYVCMYVCVYQWPTNR